MTVAMADMQRSQEEQHEATIRVEVGQVAMMSKIDEYIKTNNLHHDEFFKRTRWAVTWKGLGLALATFIAAAGTIIGIIFGIIRLHGG